jgi:hypothetical protein
MANSRSNIACDLWRSFEILLFFVISVVGFNVFLKTTSQNSRAKEKSLSEKVAAHSELSGQELTFNGGLFRLKGFFAPRSRELAPSASGSVNTAFPALPHHHDLAYPRFSIANGNSGLSLPVRDHKPANLLQQNPVLLI